MDLMSSLYIYSLGCIGGGGGGGKKKLQRRDSIRLTKDKKSKSSSIPVRDECLDDNHLHDV
jgi:hypothetical protein